jgi:hypothetical protein
MKNLLLIIVLMLNPTLYAQTTIRKTLEEKQIGFFQIKVIQSIKDGDSSNYILITYRNAKYQALVDYNTIALNLKDEIITISSELKKFSELTDKVDVNYKDSNIELDSYDSSKNVYLSDSRNGEYNSMTRAQAAKFSSILESYANNYFK